MTTTISPVEAAAIFARLTEAGWLQFAPPADPDPLLIGPDRLGKLLDITKGRAAFQMRAGLFGPLVFIGREPRVRMRGVEMWLDEQDGREGEGDGRNTQRHASGADRRGELAGGSVRIDRRTDAPRGQPGQSPSRIVAIAPRGARPASRQ